VADSRKKSDSKAIKVEKEIHRQLGIISAITGEDIEKIASDILRDPVSKKYDETLTQEKTHHKSKSKPKTD
jgi:hypothetical protein